MTPLIPIEPEGSTNVNENEVVSFLRANPAFLDEHPELLRDLSISHSAGGAVSLLERQVRVLRDESSHMKKQIQELMDFARENEILTRKIHELALTLITIKDLATIFVVLNRSLIEDFFADEVFCFVFAETISVGTEVNEFVGVDADMRTAFCDVIEAESARCGPLTEQQTGALFEDENYEGSAVIMPLRGEGWDGVVIVSSNDSEKYQTYMGTEFLTYLSNVISLTLEPWVK